MGSAGSWRGGGAPPPPPGTGGFVGGRPGSGRGAGAGGGGPAPPAAAPPRSLAEAGATSAGGVVAAHKAARRIVGRGVGALDEEKANIDALLIGLVTRTAPQLLAVFGVGVDPGAALLVTAGDNPGRLRSEAARAHLCGTAPIPASSGKVTRYRLNRGGDRQANRAPWGIVITRLRNDPRTQAHIARPLAEGRSKSEVIRILKRYVAREVHHRLPRA